MLGKIFTWWNGATLGAGFDIHRRSSRVGEDEQGNIYYEERRAHGSRRRRYVIFKGYSDASKVPPDWFGWLHHILEAPPNVTPLRRQPWERPHQPNLTGTPLAYRPPGSLASLTQAKPMDPYESWTPPGDGEGHAPANR